MSLEARTILKLKENGHAEAVTLGFTDARVKKGYKEMNSDRRPPTMITNQIQS